MENLDNTMEFSAEGSLRTSKEIFEKDNVNKQLYDNSNQYSGRHKKSLEKILETDEDNIESEKLKENYKSINYYSEKDNHSPQSKHYSNEVENEIEDTNKRLDELELPKLEGKIAKQNLDNNDDSFGNVDNSMVIIGVDISDEQNENNDLIHSSAKSLKAQRYCERSQQRSIQPIGQELIEVVGRRSIFIRDSVRIRTHTEVESNYVLFTQNKGRRRRFCYALY